MVNISLILSGSTKSNKVKWPVVPRKLEHVWYKKKKYQVSEVWHSMDVGEIKVFLVPPAY